MTWNARFSEPIELPDGQFIHTLQDAGAYVSRLPDGIYRTEEWRVATHLLIEAAEETQPVELARFAMIIALNPQAESTQLETA